MPFFCLSPSPVYATNCNKTGAELKRHAIYGIPYGMPYGKEKRKKQESGIFCHGKLMKIFRIKADLKAMTWLYSYLL